jgi:hypothetical protein
LSIQDLGSLGEFVGAIATVLTLIYLAGQIRHNTLAIKEDARRAHFATSRENNQMIIVNEDVADLWLRGLIDPEQLNPAEHARFTFLLASFVNNAELGFFERETGVIEHAEALRSMRAVAMFMRAPGGAQFWKRHGRNYHAEFRAEFEALIAGPKLKPQ